jgi:hypothetical protein
MWKKTIRWKLAQENPFAEVRAGKQTNEARQMFVPHGHRQDYRKGT